MVETCVPFERRLAGRSTGFSLDWITHLTVDRLPRLVSLLDSWDGPVVTAIYFALPDDVQLFEQTLATEDGERLADRLTGILVKADFGVGSEVDRLRYPINRLRNLALRQSAAQFVFVTDVDFVPSAGLASLLRDRAAPFLAQAPAKSAIAVPCFIPRDGLGGKQALTRSLADLLISGDVRLPDANAGHGPFLTAWSSRPKATLFELVYESQFEPYLVVGRDECQPYDERFSDQGGDKQSHLMRLNAGGWRFWGMSGAWVVHLPRNDMTDTWLLDRHLRALGGKSSEQLSRHFSTAQTDENRFRLFEDFVPELATAAGHAFRWPHAPPGVHLNLGRSFGRPWTSASFGL